jgi:4-amino-4-deoxy-L-arabinose transferase-like glycosyltransferase
MPGQTKGREFGMESMGPVEDTDGSRLSGRRGKWLAYGMLLILWLSHVVANYAWLKVDTRPPFWDMAAHAIQTIYFSSLRPISNFSTALHEWFMSSQYPPLVHWLAAPLAIVFWPSSDVFTAIQGLFLGILLVSTYGIASTFRGRKAGLLAAFIVSMYPLIYGLERYYLVDVPLVAMVALSNWLLVRTDHFQKRGITILYGCSLGLGMLTKWPFVVFTVGPLLVTAARGFKTHFRERAPNLVGALAAGAVIAGPWYILNLRSSIEFLGRMSVYARAEGDPLVGSLESWAYYARTLVNDQVLSLFALVFVLGLIVFLTRRRFWYEALWLGSWMAIPYVYFSISYNKDPRYTMPYLPAIAIVTALGISLLRPKVPRRFLASLSVLYSIVQFVGLSWGLSARLPYGLLPGRVSVRIGSTSLPLYAEAVHIASPPRNEDWKVQAVLGDIVHAEAASSRADLPSLVVLTDAAWFEQNVFKYYAAADQVSVRVVAITGVFEVEDAEAQISAGDYVVTKTGDLGPSWSTQQAQLFTDQLDDPSSALGRRFHLIREYPLPDGSVAKLYQRSL